MHELAAKQVLLDIELITLIALGIGVGVYAWLRRKAVIESPGSGHFDGYDVALMFFPALLFLLNPVSQLMLAHSVEVAEPADKNGISPLLFNVAYFAFVGLMVYGIVEWVRGRQVVEVFGLNTLSFPKIVIGSILGGVASVLICVGLIGNLSQSLLEGIFDGLAEQEPVRSLQEADSVLYLALSIFNACVAAAVVEEFLFRGYMYGALKQATNKVFAMVVVGALFAVVHGNLPALLPLWAFSILLCLAYEWTRCLWVSIGIHAFFNATNIVLMLVEQPVE
tara:strand:+ start:2441 stop:3280 length:840 start_codon:yes stop_codon:yes gene_type:complete